MKISVFGLGYVGVVTAACLSQRGHRVIGVDLQEEKVALLNCGCSPIVEPEVPEMIGRAWQQGLLSATRDGGEAVHASECSIVCVGTPSSPGGMPDIRSIGYVGSALARSIREKGEPHIIFLRSTVLPGTTARWAEEHFGDLIASGLVRLFFYPEFLRESTAVKDFLEPSLSVMGSNGPVVSLETLEEIFGTTFQVVDWKTAELLKYACNAWHATKVAFANEIGRIGSSHGIDAREVMQLLCQDTRLNISTAYLKPGNPFGGSCLPKDILALSQLGRQSGLFLPLLENLQESNRKHLDMLLEKVTRTGSREVVILGLTFKPLSDDLRESAMVNLAQTLLGYGYTLRIFDPSLDIKRLKGQNRSLIESRMPHLASLLSASPEEALGAGGTVVISQRVTSLERLKSALTPAHRVLDVNGWEELRSSVTNYEGFCW